MSALAVTAGVAVAAEGGEDLAFLGADARVETGYVTLIAGGTPGARVSFVERTDGGAERAVRWRWRCDRLTRRFAALVRNTDGTSVTPTFETRTPSCRGRVAVTVPRRVRPGSGVTVGVRDRWGIGGLRGRACIHGPRGRPRCSSLTIRGKGLHERRFRAATPGRWRVEVRTQAGLVRRVVDVGTRAPSHAPARARPVILAAGDSLMQGIDSFLADGLEPRTQVRSAVRPGTGLSKPNLLDWPRFARAQTARYQPDATVMVIGGGDGVALSTPAGVLVSCCEQTWINEYARRARAIMTTFARGGAGDVIWLSLPAPRSERFKSVFRAVNAAIARAARGMRTVRLFSLSKVFTPGFRYRARMSYRGRSVRVREVDGIHLSAEGSRIAASLVIRLLERRGIP